MTDDIRLISEGFKSLYWEWIGNGRMRLVVELTKQEPGTLGYLEMDAYDPWATTIRHHIRERKENEPERPH